MENKLDKDYQELLKDILENGTTKQTRNGEVLSVFSRTIRHKMSTGFPLLTSKKMSIKSIITELLWFLKGDSNIKYLVDNKCNIWNGDAYKSFEREKIKLYEYATSEAKKYSPDFTPSPLVYETMEEYIEKIKNEEGFAEKWGNLGQIYGKQWRMWRFTEFEKSETGIKAKAGYIDQIANLISNIKKDPDSRRLKVNAWNVGEIENMCLPPCHFSFQIYTRELCEDERFKWYYDKSENKLGLNHDRIELQMNDESVPKRAISLKYHCRSQDVPLGTPYNISSYALLLMMIAKQVNMIPEELIGDFGDCHIYCNQIEGVKEQLLREPLKLPTVILSDKIVNDISEYTLDDITLNNYKSHPKIHFPLSN